MERHFLNGPEVKRLKESGQALIGDDFTLDTYLVVQS